MVWKQNYFFNRNMKYVNNFQIFSVSINTPDMWQWKTIILSTNVDQRSLEAEFSIDVCCPTGDKWQSKILFVIRVYQLFREFLIAAYPV